MRRKYHQLIHQKMKKQRQSTTAAAAATMSSKVRRGDVDLSL